MDDKRYLEAFLKPVRRCATYTPKFGRKGSKGVTYEEFRKFYAADLFYQWVGLDSPLMYAAHKAAGGMTSIYRQLGIGGQHLFRHVLRDHLRLSDEQSGWKYEVPQLGGKRRMLEVDGRFDLADVETRTRQRLRNWVTSAAEQVAVPRADAKRLRGAVFEVRQGYKSKDSKRQHGDVGNASSAYIAAYLPVLLVLSNQIDDGITRRYVAAKWVLLTGTLDASPLRSTYAFCRDIIGYDLAAFFQRNARAIRAEVELVLDGLLRAP